MHEPSEMDKKKLNESVELKIHSLFILKKNCGICLYERNFTINLHDRTSSIFLFL